VGPGDGALLLRPDTTIPTSGRFINEDPIGFDGGMNFYAYVGNDPENR
jgi:uncharacterized protein RhaS with RHS repeats